MISKILQIRDNDNVPGLFGILYRTICTVRLVRLVKSLTWSSGNHYHSNRGFRFKIHHSTANSQDRRNTTGGYIKGQIMRYKTKMPNHLRLLGTQGITGALIRSNGGHQLSFVRLNGNHHTLFTQTVYTIMSNNRLLLSTLHLVKHVIFKLLGKRLISRFNRQDSGALEHVHNSKLPAIGSGVRHLLRISIKGT